MSTIDILSIIFAMVALVGVIGAFATRFVGTKTKGIGRIFLRFTIGIVGAPAAIVLSLQDKQTEAVVTIVLAVLGIVAVAKATNE